MSPTQPPASFGASREQFFTHIYTSRYKKWLLSECMCMCVCALHAAPAVFFFLFFCQPTRRLLGGNAFDHINHATLTNVHIFVEIIWAQAASEWVWIRVWVCVCVCSGNQLAGKAAKWLCKLLATIVLQIGQFIALLLLRVSSAAALHFFAVSIGLFFKPLSFSLFLSLSQSICPTHYVACSPCCWFL